MKEQNIEQLVKLALASFQSRPPLAEAYIDQAYELDPDDHYITLFRLKIKIYTQINNDELFETAFAKEPENEEYVQAIVKIYYEYLLFNNRLNELEKAFSKYEKYHNNDLEFQLYELYIEYLKTRNIQIFKKLKGFSNKTKELFFNFFTNFPIYSKDIKPFSKIIRRFFSNKILTLYKTFTAVQNK